MLRIRKTAVALLIIVALAGITGLIVRQVSAQAMPSSSQTTIPVAGQTLLYSADPSGQCFGEDINLTNGSVLLKSQGTVNSNGFHGTFNVVRQGIQGVGVQTGAQYELVGTDNASQYQTVNGAYTTNFTDHVNIIGQGPDNNAVLSSVFAVTWDANGQVTAIVQDYSLTCH